MIDGVRARRTDDVALHITVATVLHELMDELDDSTLFAASGVEHRWCGAGVASRASLVSWSVLPRDGSGLQQGIGGSSPLVSTTKHKDAWPGERRSA
jgi:hypothetical protein